MGKVEKNAARSPWPQVSLGLSSVRNLGDKAEEEFGSPAVRARAGRPQEGFMCPNRQKQGNRALKIVPS